MDETKQPATYYIKGKVRYLFWAWAIIQLISILVAIVNSPTVNSSGVLSTTAAPGPLAPVTMFCGIVFYLLYGIYSSDRRSGVFLIILSFLQFLSASIYLYRYLTNQLALRNNAIFYVDAVVSALLIVTWIAYAIFTLVNRRTGTILRIAAISLLVSYFLLFISPFLALLAALIMDSKSFIVYTLITLITLNRLVEIFFFAALSFSRKKQPKSLLPPSAEGTSL